MISGLDDCDDWGDCDGGGDDCDWCEWGDGGWGGWFPGMPVSVVLPTQLPQQSPCNVIVCPDSGGIDNLLSGTSGSGTPDDPYTIYDLVLAPFLDEITAGSPTPWYENPCIRGAIGNGLLHIGIDAIGLLPEGGAVASAFSLFQGAAGVSNGINILKRVKTGVGIVSTAGGAQDTSTFGEIQTGVGVLGLVPVLGTGTSIVSMGLDAIRAGMDISQCH